MGEIRTLKTVVTLSGAAVLMSLEILGSRVLAPSYGSSVYVWGSLITTFLAALALGYALGGRIADRRPSSSVLSMILPAAAVLVLPSVQWAPKLLESLARANWDTRWSSLADPVDAGTLVRHAGDLGQKWRLPGLPAFASKLLHRPEPPAGTLELTDAYAPVEALQHF